MKTVLSLVLLAIPFGAVPSRSEQQPFSLTISAEHDSVKRGSEVFVQIKVTNTSNQQISLAKAPGNLPQAESEYSIDVRDSGGREAPLTDYGRKIKEKKIIVSMSRDSLHIEPGESQNDGVIVTKLYDLSRPGKYSVRVAREIPPRWGGGIVQSNTINITITHKRDETPPKQ